MAAAQGNDTPVGGVPALNIERMFAEGVRSGLDDLARSPLVAAS